VGGLTLDRGTTSTFTTSSSREWLVTNGLGGFAAGTVSGARTRRYHGLLIASLKPPVDRILTLAQIDTQVSYAGRRYSLETREYGDGTVDPRGHLLIESFRLEEGMPVWIFALGDARIEQRVYMAHGSNTTYVRYTLLRASDAASLELAPLCAYRDYHSHWRGETHFQVDADLSAVSIRAHEGAHPYRIAMDRGEFHPDAAWYWNYRHRAEAARGLDDREDLFRPGVFRLVLAPGDSTTLTVTTETTPPAAADVALARERKRAQSLVADVGESEPAWVRSLRLAADQFIVRRGAQGGATVIAGYPWFSDWGRDTMIALPGLTLATGRFADAAAILRTFAQHVDQGMLPNRFPDAGETPEYNTVDATLWYFHAIDAYVKASGDRSLAHELYPVLKDIVAWHRLGTRYSIHVDERDSLLYAGEAGVQLTWMDAKLGDWVVTPRIGKPVEVNALWYNALEVTAALAHELGDRGVARELANLAARTAKSIASEFDYAEGGYLYDVIDTPDGELNSRGKRVDTSFRPNQIFAVSLPHCALGISKARTVVDLCARELWTPVGLRSLASSHRDYSGRYAGDPRQRDGAYHQGTVWSWLLGPFVRAHLRVHADPVLARSYLEPMGAHLEEACIGSISEVFDGDAPHAPEGCFAQAWGVAEVLSAWREVERAAANQSISIPRRAVP